VIHSGRNNHYFYSHPTTRSKNKIVKSDSINHPKKSCLGHHFLLFLIAEDAIVHAAATTTTIAFFHYQTKTRTTTTTNYRSFCCQVEQEGSCHEQVFCLFVFNICAFDAFVARVSRIFIIIFIFISSSSSNKNRSNGQ
jgi:hypothetical protein